MIFWSIFKILNWLYDWGEVTEDARRMMTVLSGVEMVVVTFLLIGLCSIYLPDIIKSWRKK